MTREEYSLQGPLHQWQTESQRDQALANGLLGGYEFDVMGFDTSILNPTDFPNNEFGRQQYYAELRSQAFIRISEHARRHPAWTDVYDPTQGPDGTTTAQYIVKYEYSEYDVEIRRKAPPERSYKRYEGLLTNFYVQPSAELLSQASSLGIDYEENDSADILDILLSPYKDTNPLPLLNLNEDGVPINRVHHYLALAKELGLPIRR